MYTMHMRKENVIYIIQTESAIRGYCILGQGATSEAAWEDAYGPAPYTKFTARGMKNAWCSKVSPETLHDLLTEAANR